MKVMMMIECKNCHEIYETHYPPHILICRECRSTEFVVLEHFEPTEISPKENAGAKNERCLPA